MTALETFGAGKPLAVDFTAIERELAALWKEAAASRAIDGPTALVRACHLNLMVSCHSAAEATRATAIVDQVVRVHPCRVLMAVIDDAAAGDGLEAFLSAHCAYAPGSGRGSQVCCEQITINASPASAPRLQAAVLPLLLPDLPVILWWPGDPDLGLRMLPLIESADRLALDLRCMRRPGAQLKRLASLGLPVIDLAWQRLRMWRDVTARLFDEPALADQPARVERIVVACDGGAVAEAILLGCWAASRLGWKAAAAPSRTSEGGLSAGMARAGSKAGLLEVRPGPAEGQPARVNQLSLQAPGASFDLTRSPETECVVTTVTRPGPPCAGRSYRAVDRDDGALLCRGLEAAGRDAGYHDSALLAGRLLEPLDEPAGETDR